MVASSPNPRVVRAAGVVCALAALAACESPWERPVVTVATTEQAFEIYAEGASLGTWLDKRERSQITHGMLVIDGPKEKRSYFAPGTTYVVTTNNPLIAERSQEMSENLLRLPRGMRTNFALGNTVTVRIERIGIDGAREPVEEGRVSFLEIVLAGDGQQ
jgi:hypothetical protein